MAEFSSGEAPKSEIKKSRFSQFLSTLYGWRRGRNAKEGAQAVDFVSVDLDSKENLAQALINNLSAPQGKIATRLEELFADWLADTQDSAAEIASRRQRVDQLMYAKLNDPFIGRVVKLYADECTQLDIQDQVIAIESPDIDMTKEMYKLLNQWGVTQQRVRSAIEQMATFGDAFWANKISDQGVERIIPMKQLQVSERLEFNPVKALEEKKRREGSLATLASRNQLVQQMLDDITDTMDFADLFDTKLFGYVVEDDLVVPPWSVTHFRVEADSSEFYPFGTSPILGTLAPFKLTQSTITLQSIARILSFPVTLYKVKTTDKADEGLQFATVNRVREEYDNVGVNPAAGNSEVYSVNTKIWMPDGLLDVDVKDPKVEIGFVDDIAMYSDRVAVATGIPKGYLVQDRGGWFGASARSLMEQFKPFARSAFTLQTAFLEGLADLFRLHFAITGQFDFRVPFTLSLKFPAEEASSDKNKARSDSIEMAKNVLDLIRTAIGAEEDEGLPPEIVRDVLAKYSFLSATEVMKWTRGAMRSRVGGGGSVGEDSFGEEAFDLDDLGDETFGDYGEDVELAADEEDTEEALDAITERAKKEANKLREVRLRELSRRYRESADDLYFKVLKENVIGDFVRHSRHVHVSTSQHPSTSLMMDALTGQSGKSNRKRISETTITDILRQIKEDNEASIATRRESKENEKDDTN